MLVSELITRLREDYLDDTLGVADNDSLVSEPALIRFADEAQDQACRRGNILYDEDDATVCRITLVDGTRAYQLNSKINVLERVSLEGVDLIHTTEHQLDRDYTGWRLSTVDEGTPTHYYIKQRTLHTYPVVGIVDDGKTLDLSAYIRPKVQLTAVGDSFEIFEEAQDDLVYWMLYRVYNLRDEDLNDPTAAALYYGLFETTYGPEVSARVRIHQFENPRILQHYSTDSYSATNKNARQDDDFDGRRW